jgi:hypothetical protein
VCIKVVLVLIFSAVVVVQLLLFELLHWRLVVLFLVVVAVFLCLLGSVPRGLCAPLLFHLSVV